MDAPSTPTFDADDFVPSESTPGDKAVATNDTKTSVIAKIGLFAADKWKLTLAVWLAVIAAGLYSFFGGLDREGFPPVDVPIVVVDGTYFVDDEVAVDAEVAVPLQASFSDVDGVKEVTSIALPNAFAIIVEFDSGFSSPDGAALLQPAADSVSTPEGAVVVVRALEATKFVEVYDILVSVSGPAGATAAELEAESEKIRAYLEGTNGVIAAETRNLITEGLDPATGEEVARQTRFTRTVFAGDDAFVPAIAVGLIRDPDDETLDILSFSDSVTERLASPDAPQLAEGYSAAITADFASDIRTQVNSLIGNLVTGLAAVVLVSFLLIGWRASIVTALFMVTVVMTALTGLLLLGYTLNTITLFGLILTIGLLVDDAIVIGESIDATKGEGGTKERIIGVALTRVAMASLAGTLTTVLVFGPLLFVGGILGEFIRAIPATVIITLVVSYVASVIFIPALSKFLILEGKPARNPVISLEKWTGKRLSRLASFPARRGPIGWVVGVFLALLPIAAIMSAGSIAGGLGFNIFPAAKDANVLFIGVDFAPGSTIEQAEDVADDIDAAIVAVLGDDLESAQYIRGNERRAEVFIDLVPFDERDTKAPVYRQEIEDELLGVQGARTSVSVLDAGPPVEDFPFAVQINAADDNIEAAKAVAEELVEVLPGTVLDKSGETTTITEAIDNSVGQVTRLGGQRYEEVRAGFDNDDLTANLAATEDLVNDLFPAERLTEIGLEADALAFDFGRESDNQDDFAALGTSGLVALGLMLLLLIVQFRSLLQPILVFLAIPFSFFGLTSALALTDNGISFFSAVGFIALIGVVVNNTILLVDSANQARRSGLGLAGSIEQAVSRRFRPLIATTITTVVGLLPLALSDPFWEGLSFTLMGGLVSSTILVLISFPVYYLVLTGAVEWVKDRVVPSRRRARAASV